MPADATKSGGAAAQPPTEGHGNSLCVVIPTLNAAARLPDTLAALAPGKALICDVLVADADSTDRTVAAAEAAGARVLQAPRGRGQQLKAGAAATTGDWLLFLHADTRLAPDWATAATAFMADPANADRAAAFRFRLDDTDRRARRVERLVAWRCRTLGLPYGDQALLVSRQRYHAVGGYRPLPLMEDVDLVRRLGRGRMTILAADAVTAADRFRRDGYWWRPIRNLAFLLAWLLGVPPVVLARYY